MPMVSETVSLVGGSHLRGGVAGVSIVLSRVTLFPMPHTDHSTAKHAPHSACADGSSSCPQPCAGANRDRECQWSVRLTLSSSRTAHSSAHCSTLSSSAQRSQRLLACAARAGRCRTLSDTVGHCRVLSDTVRYCRILPDTVSDTVGHCRNCRTCGRQWKTVDHV